MNKINWLIFSLFVLLASSCTKVEIEPYECEGAETPYVSQTNYIANIGDEIVVNATSNNTVYCIKPDGKLSTLSYGYLKVPINKSSQGGVYKFYTLSTGCTSDTVSVTIQVNPVVSPPCSPATGKYTINGITSDIYFYYDGYYYSQYETDYTDVYSINYRESNGSISNSIEFSFPIYQIPPTGRAFFIDSTEYLLEDDFAFAMYGQSLGQSWKATSGTVYTQLINGQSYLVFCNVRVRYYSTGSYTTISGKMSY